MGLDKWLKPEKEKKGSKKPEGSIKAETIEDKVKEPQKKTQRKEGIKTPVAKTEPKVKKPPTKTSEQKKSPKIKKTATIQALSQEISPETKETDETTKRGTTKINKFKLVCSNAKCNFEKTLVKKELSPKDRTCPKCKSEMKIKK